MLVAALLLGAGLAHWLSRRIRSLAEATNSLIRGNYAVRVQPTGHDELARLAADFNTLAGTLDAASHARRQWIADIAHFFFNDPATPEIYTLSLHDALPI